jgi:GPH family glycoside/pentoside/hexuronide:cation symporter
MLGLFAVAPPVAPVLWFAITITGLFTAYSFLTIAFYGQGVATAARLPGGHVRLAAWRESGALLGVCLAAVAPAVLAPLTGAPFAVFASGFAALVLLAVLAMAPEWSGHEAHAPTPIRTILADQPARRLLILALVNATPVAVSSTLFLFFVEHRLGAPGWEGPLLVLFFLTAAVSSPLWSRAAARWGERPVLVAAMTAAILSFGTVLALGPGDVWLFAVICLISGATIGADLTLLPALFARRMARIAPGGGQGFGLWSFMNKATLAFAAVLLLPAIEAAGFDAQAATQPATALTMLTLLYAGVPCILKLLAIGLILTTRLED